ncbi:MAG: terpene synthase family protein [Anaerolineae bacterium]
MKTYSLNALKAPTPGAVINVHADTVETQVIDLCHSLGIWQEHIHEYNTMSAYLFPYADREALMLIGLYNNLLYFVDDQFDRHKTDECKDAALLQALFRQAAQMMLYGEGHTNNPILATVYELRHGLIQIAPSAAWLERFVKDTIEHLQSSLEDVQPSVNDSVDSWFDHYNELRDLDSGMAPTINLIELALGCEIPLHIRDMSIVQEARHYVTRYCSLSNDLFSYDKEVVAYQSEFNAVAMLQRDGYSFDEAVNFLIDELNTILDGFKTLYQNVGSIPSFNDLDDVEKNSLCLYLDALWHQIVAAYHWQFSTNRYRSDNSAFDELRNRL